jgi:hypothetical protein
MALRHLVGTGSVSHLRHQFDMALLPAIGSLRTAL